MEVFGYFAGALTLIAFLPQTIRTIRIRETRDLSLATFLTISISGVFWVVYGLSKSIPAIWITNAVVAICTSIIVALKLKHG